MAQRSLLLPAMAVAAVLGAVAAAVVVAGRGDTTSDAAAPPVTVTLPATTGDASAGAAGTDGQTDPGAGDQGAQGDQQQGDQGQDEGTDDAVVVPSLVGMRLDDATSALASAQLEREVDGGGLFGVLDDTAWMVCDTTPEAGTEVVPGEVVVVHVDRAC